MLTWRPVVVYELRECEIAKLKIAHEQRLKQIDEFDSRFDIVLFNFRTYSTSHQSTADNSKE